MSKATVLIVDNDDMHASFLNKILSRQDYTIVESLASGEEAITFLADKQVDLILMDFELAGVVSAINTARTIHETSDTPIIFLTGLDQGQLIEEAEITGPYDFLSKPVGEQQLILTLGIALHRHSFEHNLRERQRALEINEAAVCKKLQATLVPEGDIGTLALGNIIDTPPLQTLMEDFHKLTGLSIGIFDTEGKVLLGVGWQDICTKFHRCHPDTLKKCLEGNTILSSGASAGSTKAYRCKNNLCDLMTPIDIGGQHVGNICLGQFFYDDESLDYEFFRNQAKKYGFDEAAYIRALDRVPRLSREKVAATMAFYTSLSLIISTLSYNSVMLSRTLAEKNVALQELSENRAFQISLLENIPIPVFAKDTAGRYLVCNSAYKDFFGKTSEQILNTDAFALHPPELAQFYHDKDD